jgi:hypothetical protein
MLIQEPTHNDIDYFPFGVRDQWASTLFHQLQTLGGEPHEHKLGPLGLHVGDIRDVDQFGFVEP